MDFNPHALYRHVFNDVRKYLPTLCESDVGVGRKIDFWPGIEPSQVACVQLLNAIVKKFQPRVTKAQDARALEKFLACNQACHRRHGIDLENLTELEAIAIGGLKDTLIQALDSYPHDGGYITSDVLDGMGHGPGTATGVKGESFYEKVASQPVTGTNKSVFQLFNRWISRWTSGTASEAIRRQAFGCFTWVRGSFISFQPKSSEISRPVVPQPSANMLVQKGLANLLRQQLKNFFGVNLEAQQFLNQRLALEGSVNGRFCTIDLSSASDTIALRFCREVLPRGLLRWLLASRVPYVILPGGRDVKLHMIASMGNDYVFPLETILFSAIIHGCYKALGLTIRRPRDTAHPGNWGCYGDDLVVRREAYDLVIKVLIRCGFTPNQDKSFRDGPFRESCGHDYWSGYNVRGVYVTALSSKQDRISAINRLVAWSCNHGIELNQTIAFLRGGMGLNAVPPYEDEVAGLKLPYHLASFTGDLSTDGSGGTIAYKAYRPVPRSVKVDDLGDAPHLKVLGREVLHNPPGLLMSASCGSLRDGRLTPRLRLEGVHYQKRLCFSQGWDWIDPSSGNFTRMGWERFNSAFLAHLLDKEEAYYCVRPVIRHVNHRHITIRPPWSPLPRYRWGGELPRGQVVSLGVRVHGPLQL